MDEFTKVMTRRMQINALAAREASYRSARLRGKEADRVYAKTLDAVTQRPTAEAFVRAKNEFEAVGADYDPAKSYAGDTRLEDAADVLASVDLHEMANDYARLMAFQKTGPAVEAFEKAMKYIPIVKALYVPFLRTPLNLVRGWHGGPQPGSGMDHEREPGGVQDLLCRARRTGKKPCHAEAQKPTS